jgi:hypothetical protein
MRDGPRGERVALRTGAGRERHAAARRRRGKHGVRRCYGYRIKSGSLTRARAETARREEVACERKEGKVAFRRPSPGHRPGSLSFFAPRHHNLSL